MSDSNGLSKVKPDDTKMAITFSTVFAAGEHRDHADVES